MTTATSPRSRLAATSRRGTGALRLQLAQLVAGAPRSVAQARPAPHVAQPGHVPRRGRRGAHHRHRDRRAVPRRLEPSGGTAVPDGFTGASRSGSGSPCSSRTSPSPSPRAAARRRPQPAHDPHQHRSRTASPPTTTTADPDAERARDRGVASADLRLGDVVVVDRRASSSRATATSSRGIASVDESAITGESAPVIRESRRRPQRRHRRHPRAVATASSCSITSKPGETFVDRMIRARRGRSPPEDAERDRAQHPAREPVDRLPRRRAHAQPDRVATRRARRASRCSSPCWSASSRPRSARCCQRDRHRRHGPARAAQRARDVGPRGRGGRRRHDAAARQDRHDHLRQPPGDRVRAGARRSATTSSRAPRRSSSLADPTPEGTSVVDLAERARRPRREPAPTATSCRSPRRPA